MPIATSFGVLNYSGMLFNKGNTRTPLSAIIGSRASVYIAGGTLNTAAG